MGLIFYYPEDFDLFFFIKYPEKVRCPGNTCHINDGFMAGNYSCLNHPSIDINKLEVQVFIVILINSQNKIISYRIRKG